MATRSKHRKNHKQKVEARRKRMAQEKSRNQKLQREFIMNLIKQEQEKGMFENTSNVDGPMIDGPMVDGPMIDGPMVDGPMVDGPMVDGPMVDGPMVDGPMVDGPMVDVQEMSDPIVESTTTGDNDSNNN
jgi:hypothetical protein